MAEPIVIIDSDDDCPPTNSKEQQPTTSEKGLIAFNCFKFVYMILFTSTL